METFEQVVPIGEPRLGTKRKISFDVSDENKTKMQKREKSETKHPFHKLTVKELRQVALEFRVGIKRGWKKIDILDALLNHMLVMNAVKVCQRYIRGYFVRRWYASRGVKSTFKNAMNETDFFTLEPLKNIVSTTLCGIIDNNKFSYVFHLHSLTALIKQATELNGYGMRNNKHFELINPYTREVFEEKNVKCIVDFCFLSYLLRTEIVDEVPWNLIGGILKGIRPDARSRTQRHYEETQCFLTERRLLDTRARIVNLFIYVDLLGNYSNINWFLDLNLGSLIQFATILKEVWEYRGRIPEEIKKRICPFHNPFAGLGVVRNLLVDYGTIDYTYLGERYLLDLETTRTYCIHVMENMVYTSDDIHHRNLGALYILMSLTGISRAARNGLPWLFDGLS